MTASLGGGKYVIPDAAADVGSFHGATAADLNGDGAAYVVTH